MTVLVIDDEPMILHLVSHALGNAGYETLVCDCATDALRILSNVESIGAVVTDFVMPEMNGIELIERARKAKPSLRAILMTGYDLSTVSSSNKIEFIPKPCSMATLVEAVGRSLRVN